MEDWQPGDDPLEVNAFAEQFELVCTEETGNELAGVFQELMDALETGRLGAKDAVIAAVQIRRRATQEISSETPPRAQSCAFVVSSSKRRTSWRGCGTDKGTAAS
ncbi:hypothetical protein P3T76_015229 [Phytophthora citrophthora]|uniref:Uncharacterized protein n=1 Tax=Phytophthora citrophthora TaxID=4793 RepID=A0AAD9G0I8_9STRA|nr:hypothetical protein P3T76_015229 [Phytophthora citrophthora]